MELWEFPAIDDKLSLYFGMFVSCYSHVPICQKKTHFPKEN